MRYLIIMGLIGIMLISGCNQINDYRLNNYECNEGTKSGGNCYTEPQLMTYNSNVKFDNYRIMMIDEIIWNREDIIKTVDKCVYQERTLLNITSIKINNKEIEIGQEIDGIERYDEFELLNNMNEDNEFNLNVSFYYNWRRTIWIKSETSFPYCIDKLKEIGAEVI